jgi:diguanylate cyclase (GGDEF)-like protein
VHIAFAAFGFDYRNFLLRWLFPCIAVCAPVWVCAQPVPSQYRCDSLADVDQIIGLHAGWTQAANGKIPLSGLGETCWVRINHLSHESIAQNDGWLSFGDLNVQRVDITLFDAKGRKLGHAKRLGASQEALVTGYRALFPRDHLAVFPLFARLDPIPGAMPIPGLSRNLLIESVSPAATFLSEQAEDLLNLSGAVFLLVTALMALFFGLTLREVNYGIYALYASLQSLTIFTKSGLTFVLNVSSSLWLNPWFFQYLVAVLSVLLSVRFGRFALHSPKTTWVAYAVALAFILLIPVHFFAPAVGSALVYALVPLHFLVLLSGNWRGWRHGERGCGILLIGLIPISFYWAIFLFYQVFLHEPIPSEVAIGSTFDFFRTLLLPMAFFYGIADRTLGLQRDMARLAQYDSLTGHFNREGLRHYGQSQIDEGQKPCILMLNIERFHAINDTLGPTLGDKILTETGHRLDRLCRFSDKARVGRMHADQFCIYLPSVDALATIRKKIDQEFEEPAEIQGQAVDIALAVGYACSDQLGSSMSQLLRNSEVALDAARVQHRNWTEYRVELETSQLADLDLLSELKRAVEMDELRVYLQPKVYLKDGVVSSAEALVRWMHPKRGLIAPADFVPFAEKTGRITLLTGWVLETAMRYAVQRRREGKAIQISVNLSTFDLSDAGFASRVAKMAEEIGVDTQDIRLEVTESGAMQDPAATLLVMKDLRTAGFSLSIDDFGTGYSSLAYLQKMPVAELKIDRAFVRKVHAGSEGALLLDSTIALGHRLGLSVVAEGAETAEEWALLRALGCDYVQGWFAAPPMPIDQFELWCQDNSPFLA